MAPAKELIEALKLLANHEARISTLEKIIIGVLVGTLIGLALYFIDVQKRHQSGYSGQDRSLEFPYANRKEARR